MKNFLEKHSEYFYLVFRVIVGALFLLHGVQKLPGILNGSTGLGLIFFAGIIETVGGALLILGLLTRYVALITAIEMLVAYFTAHFPNGLNPLQNRGEASLLFFAAFLVLLAFGAGKNALDNWLKH